MNRGEVWLAQVGRKRRSAVNCDGLHTVPKTMLTELVGELDRATMVQVCRAASYAIGC